MRIQNIVNTLYSSILQLLISTLVAILKPFSSLLNSFVSYSDTIQHWYHDKIVEFHDFIELIQVKNDEKTKHIYMCDDELDARIEWAWRRFHELSPVFTSSDYWPKAKQFMFDKRVKSCLLIPQGKMITNKQKRKLDHVYERLANHFFKETQITRWAELY